MDLPEMFKNVAFACCLKITIGTLPAEKSQVNGIDVRSQLTLEKDQCI